MSSAYAPYKPLLIQMATVQMQQNTESAAVFMDYQADDTIMKL
jgi:hypothetical protein